MYMAGPFNSGAAVGGNGVATANKDSAVPVQGEVLAAFVKYNDTPPAGTTVTTIKTKGTRLPSYNILVITNAATDGLFPVRVQAVDPAAAGLTYDGTRKVCVPTPIDDYLNIIIAGANAGDNVDVWLLMK